MGEPEDLIIDGAYLASRLARDVWRRYAPPPAENVLRLSGIRLRVELFLHALFAVPIEVAAATAPAPVSWLARLAGRSGAAPDGLAGTDGAGIYLPAALDATSGMDVAFENYLLAGVQQSVRLVRGSATLALGISNREVHDRFLLAEAIAVDAWIAGEAPGLLPALRAARREALAHRSRARPRSLRERGMEEHVRAFLALDPTDRYDAVPTCPTSSDALTWARSLPAAGDDRSDTYRGTELAAYWGRPYAPPSLRNAEPSGEDGLLAEPPARPRVAEMRRRPRAREADEEDDDKTTGTWIIRTDEPQESVEDPFGLNRPADRADEADPEGLGDSLAELPEAQVVRSPGQPKEILRAGEEMPRAIVHRTAAAAPPAIAYPEWDFRSGAYCLPGAIVRDSPALLGDPAWAAAALARHGRLVRRVRARFERLRPRRTRVGRQADGADVDIDEYVTSVADGHAGAVAEDRLYIDERPGRRELSVALLVDVSASTDSWVSGNQRIVDVEKDALLVVCEALDALGDPHAIFTFSGESADRVSITSLKEITERTGDIVRQRIAALEANGYTRVGAAIRHVTAGLARQRAARRLLLLLSDGKPNDVDDYAGPYGVEDARQAVAEARSQDVDVFCLTVDREAPRYAPRIFGPNGFTVLRQPDQLPEALIEVLRRLLRG